MSLDSLITYKFSEQSDNSIFFEKPAKVQINEKVVTQYAASLKIEVLIKELREKGPLIALTEIGPSFYTDAPFKLGNKVGQQDIYGWKPKAVRTASSKKNYLMILGAKKSLEIEYIYFTLSHDTTEDQNSYIRQHVPSKIDTKIYVVSHKTFRDHLIDLHSAGSLSISNNLNKIEIDSKISVGPAMSTRDYAEKISAIMPLDTILDRGSVEKQCKEIGQQAFDEFKRQANGSSMAGKEAVQEICTLISSIASDGKLRIQYIERAWEGIGDEQWRWRA